MCFPVEAVAETDANKNKTNLADVFSWMVEYIDIFNRWYTQVTFEMVSRATSLPLRRVHSSEIGKSVLHDYKLSPRVQYPTKEITDESACRIHTR
jgi:hypothetical protein